MTNETAPLFYKPADGVAADFIPFYWDGQYHLFYLKDYRDIEEHGDGTPWFHIVTRDFVHFDDWGEALERGPAGSQDRWVFTGCVLEREGLFHIFYTGHNSHFANTEQPVQAVMHATSPDLRTWTKHPQDTFFAPPQYEKDDWRDPFVFWNEEANEYWMLLAARVRNGPSRNRGITALATSADLARWEIKEPFWAPDLYFTHECPDLFRIGDWWYLVYSTFSDRAVTHYRMSRSLNGPWEAPATDTFDGRAHYAAKTASDGNRRSLFGWLATRDGETDTGNWQWGGHLVVHEIRQRGDGTLQVCLPATIMDRFVHPVAANAAPILGEWAVGEGSFAAAAIGRHSALSLGVGPDRMLLETEINFSEGTAACGVLLHMDGAMDSYYQLRLEPGRQRMVLDLWPRGFGNDSCLIERPIALHAGETVRLQAIIDGTCLVAYANGVALSCRLYNLASGSIGLFVTEGETRFDSTLLKVV